MAYAVFEDLDLTEFANHIPSLSFEVEADEAPVSAAAIIDDLGAITGLAPSLSPGEATPLRGFGIASGGSVRSVLRRSPPSIRLPYWTTGPPPPCPRGETPLRSTAPAQTWEHHGP